MTCVEHTRVLASMAIASVQQAEALDLLAVDESLIESARALYYETCETCRRYRRL